MEEPKSLYEWKVTNPLVPPLEQDASDLAEEVKNNPLTSTPIVGYDPDLDSGGNFLSITIYTDSPQSPELTEYWKSRHWEVEFLGLVVIRDFIQNPYPTDDDHL